MDSRKTCTFGPFRRTRDPTLAVPVNHSGLAADGGRDDQSLGLSAVVAKVELGDLWVVGWTRDRQGST